MPELKQPLTRLLMLYSALALMTACVSTKPGMSTTAAAPVPVVVTRPDCVNWRHISYASTEDSAATIREIIRNNSAWQIACGAK